MRTDRLPSRRRRGLVGGSMGPTFEAESLEVRSLMSVGFQYNSYLASDLTPAVPVTLVRSSTLGSEKAEFRTTDGTAMPGVDYQPVTQTVVFEDGEATATVAVPLLSNPANASGRSVTLTVQQGPTSGPPLPSYPGSSIPVGRESPRPSYRSSTGPRSSHRRSSSRPGGGRRSAQGYHHHVQRADGLASVPGVGNYVVRNNTMDLKPCDRAPTRPSSASARPCFDSATNTVTLTPIGRPPTSKNGFYISSTPPQNNSASMILPSRLVDQPGTASPATPTAPGWQLLAYASKDPHNDDYGPAIDARNPP
jgi:hypothetical protein